MTGTHVQSGSWTSYSRCFLLTVSLLLLTSASLAAEEPAAGDHRVFLNEVVVQVAPGTDIQAFQQAHGLDIAWRFQSDPNTYVLRPADAGNVANRLAALRNDSRVHMAEQNYIPTMVQEAFVPNDPLYFTSGGFNGQWHLNNTLGRPHVNTAGAWNRNLTGAGVVIGIVDAGVEPAHVDMAANFSATHTYDFVVNSPTQNFVNSDSHGMAVAGVAAARGGNGIGVTGAAPFATVGSMKVFRGSGGATAAGFADATLFRSSGAITDIDIKNHSYGIASPFGSANIQNNAFTTSGQAGTIHTQSAGNGRNGANPDSGKRMTNNNPYVITVAALGFNGVFSNYSNFGANVFVTAPSNRTDVSAAGNSISTTDRTGNIGYNTNGASNYADLDFTNNFGGTSSAAPLVAGVLALGKQANPNMDSRLAKHLLARTATIVHAGDASVSSDGGWRTNAAGFHFNQNYGFGLVDADAFTLLAPQYMVTPLVVVNSGTQSVNTALPDNSLAGITRSVVNSTVGFMEELQVTLNFTHARRGDLTAFVTSPSGFTSRMFINVTNDDANVSNFSWTFTMNAFWGEEAQGEWFVNLRDVRAGSTGTWNSFSMSWRMGTIVPVPEPSTLALFGLIGAGACGRWFWRRHSLQKG